MPRGVRWQRVIDARHSCAGGALPKSARSISSLGEREIPRRSIAGQRGQVSAITLRLREKRSRQYIYIYRVRVLSLYIRGAHSIAGLMKLRNDFMAADR